jgi:S-adenosylmethionine:tRNA ribosyltransferase-isomerase
MHLDDFRFELPEELIAKFPATPRDNSRLLVINRQSSQLQHCHFYDLPKFLNSEDLLVLNNTKVLPARLFGRDKENRSFEVFLLKSLSSSKLTWECLVRPGKKVKSGIELQFEQGGMGRIEPIPNQVFQITFSTTQHTNILDWLFEVGRSPLPPYIKREADAEDKTTYQTVYAKNTGSVAAPTAGLHFTENLLANLHQKGVHTAEVTLHVGYGTFSPIRTENILDHRMHSEDYEIPDKTLQEIAETKRAGKRIFAVGTTSLRTLESYPTMGAKSSTNIYITPGYQLKVADGLVTNFHLPESSLYVLVCSLLGIERCRKVYQEAIRHKYRFYSYGDAMLIL